jgi:hypothetical protein
VPDLDVAVTVAVQVVTPGRFVKVADVPVTTLVIVFLPRFNVTVYFFTGDPPT